MRRIPALVLPLFAVVLAGCPKKEDPETTPPTNPTTTTTTTAAVTATATASATPIVPENPNPTKPGIEPRVKAELDNRPDWVEVPLTGLRSLIG